MTGFDHVVISVLLASVLIGVWRGLVTEVLSLLGWPIAFLLSNIYSDNFAWLVPMKQEALRATAAYVLMFVGVLVIWGVLVWILNRLLKTAGLGQMDRILGGLFGIVRGGLVVLALVWLSGVTDMPEKPVWREAMTSKALEDVALLTKGWLPESIAHRIHYRIRS
jgi:membrane protein required for colicin V production